MVFSPYGTINMQAKLILRRKTIFPDGAIQEMIIWQLPEKTFERPHDFKYRLHYGMPGQISVRYDNETGKGDHRHTNDGETLYEFSTAEQLIIDFLRDVRRLRGETSA